ncbi:type II secretion system protein GspL [Vibrio sp. 404]|uniref:Type II secretion system protein L n=1 Tax=Vibrio marinisediminis TaxID=2758441 RepID=A0A7W2FRD4_9VIBR|nr:type II secretion system protein GspL [Vibrio marinisediminis]
MSEYLVVRLSNNRQASQQWLVWSESQQEVIASGELSAGQALVEIESYAQQRPTIVLLNSADVLLKQVTIPAGGARQFDSMLPYLIEDDVAQDVESLHITTLAKQGDQAFIAAVDKEWLSAELASLAEAGFLVTKVIPDALALPDVEGIAAVEISDQWLLKKSAYQALTVESDWLAIVAQSDWVKTDQQWLALEAYSPLPALSLAEGQAWQQGEPQLVMQLLARHAIVSKINLLTGGFKPKSSLLKHLKIWQKSAIAAVVLVVVLLAQSFIHTQQAQQQADLYRAESERIFRAVLAKSKIPTTSYLKRELENEAKRLAGGSAEESILHWLVKLPGALKNVPNFEMTGLTFDSKRGEIKLQARSKGFQSFEQARTQLEQQFQVEQGQLTKAADFVTGSFVLKLQ